MNDHQKKKNLNMVFFNYVIYIIILMKNINSDKQLFSKYKAYKTNEKINFLFINNLYFSINCIF